MGVERNEISEHQVKVFRVVSESDHWLSAKEVSCMSGVAPRTARMHCLSLVVLGIFDQAEVFPGHRYRISKFASQRNKTYVHRIKVAAEVLGIELSNKENK